MVELNKQIFLDITHDKKNNKVINLKPLTLNH